MKTNSRTSLVVQWLSFCVSSAGGAGLIPEQGIRFHMPFGVAKKKKLLKENPMYHVILASCTVTLRSPDPTHQNHVLCETGSKLADPCLCDMIIP